MMTQNFMTVYTRTLLSPRNCILPSSLNHFIHEHSQLHFPVTGLFFLSWKCNANIAGYCALLHASTRIVSPYILGLWYGLMQYTAPWYTVSVILQFFYFFIFMLEIESFNWDCDISLLEMSINCCKDSGTSKQSHFYLSTQPLSWQKRGVHH